MKKIIIFSMMCLMALTMQAQRCAVLDFNTSKNMTAEDIEGISYIFSSNFYPSGYQVLERPYVQRVIRNKGYQPTNMTQQQRLSVGRNLNASIIVVGDVNLFMDEYNLDVQVKSVETGGTITSTSVSFKRSEYRENIKALAKELANRVSGRQSNSSTGNSTRRSEQGYVDLRLPSGTLWKATNESGLYDYDSAVRKYGSKLPTQEQWEELKGYCTWKWTGNGYKVSGDNGKFIVLPAAGFRYCDGDVSYVGSYGGYWSSSPSGSERAWGGHFDSGGVSVDSTDRCYGHSVRLVQD